MIIDTQAHVFPSIPYFGDIDREYSGDLLVAEMDSAGVDKCILISYAFKDMEFDAMVYGNGHRKVVCKEYFVKAYKDHPDRFIWYTYGFDMKNPAYLDIIKEDVAMGAQGIKLFPSVTGFSLEDPRLIPLFEYCQQQELPIILALELWNISDRWPNTTDYGYLASVVSGLIQKYDAVRWNLCHLGCFNWRQDPQDPLALPEEVFKNIDEFIKLMRYPNVWTDVAAIAWYYDEPYPYPTALKLIKRLVNEIGIDKFMFGTDWPWSDRFCTYKQMVDMIRYADFLSESDKQKFLGLNAMKYVGLASERPKRSIHDVAALKKNLNKTLININE